MLPADLVVKIRHLVPEGHGWGRPKAVAQPPRCEPLLMPPQRTLHAAGSLETEMSRGHRRMQSAKMEI
jgi:hypothetical protein